MKTAHEIVQNYIGAHRIDMAHFNEWFDDAGYPQDEANIHDGRYLFHLENFVEERETWN